MFSTRFDNIPLKFFITSFFEVPGLLFTRGDDLLLNPLFDGFNAEKFALLGVASPIFLASDCLCSPVPRSSLALFVWRWLLSDALRFRVFASRVVLHEAIFSLLERGMHHFRNYNLETKVERIPLCFHFQNTKFCQCVLQYGYTYGTLGRQVHVKCRLISHPHVERMQKRLHSN